LCNWPEALHGYFETLHSGIDKKENAFLWIATNAGVIGGCWWKVYQTIDSSPEWFKSIGTEEQSHMSAAARKRQKEMLLSWQYRRLICNLWVPPLSSAISEEDLLGIIHEYEYPMRPDHQQEAGWSFVASADLSSVADHSAIILLAVNSRLGKIRVALSKRFVPRGGKVDLITVFETMKSLHQQYRPLVWYLDTYESRRLAQEFQRFGARVVIQNLNGQTGNVAVAALTSSITSGALEISPRCESLLDDLRSLEIYERNGLLKIRADRNRRGHSDEGFSLVQGIAGAQDLASLRYTGPLEISTGFAERNVARLGVHLHRAPRSPRLGIHLDVGHGSGWVRL
jgi:hypothetical protein